MSPEVYLASNEAKLLEPQKILSLGTLYGSVDSVDVPSTNSKTEFWSDLYDLAHSSWTSLIIQNSLSHCC